jgi:hypothetical protein
MKSVTLRDIRQGYHGLKRLAQKSAKAGDFETAMKYVDHCVTVASQFNWIYSDDELEVLLDTIAQEKINTKLAVDFESVGDNWVFFDDYCTSYVLALQWMNALSKTGKRILYITTQFSFEGRRDISILGDIKQMPNVVVDVVPDGSLFDRANYLYRSILGFRASKVILHKAMNSLIQLPLCVLPKEIQIYNINLGDQFFWLGVRHINYNIEFRPFGASVSIQRRGFRLEQLLMIPFYPADEKRPFLGFPKGCEGKLVIFSGGDYYKTWDKGGTYWRLVKIILDKHKDVVFLFATKRNTKGNDDIIRFIQKNHFEKRFFYIDYRQDIFQVFAHCDIFMGTCPTSGSLMSQLAAINAKPILQYYAYGTPDDETEQAICINETLQISFHSEDEFINEADKLIVDAEYRYKQGLRLKSAMIQPTQFDELVLSTLFTTHSQCPIILRPINYHLLEKRWLVLEKRGFTNVGAFIRSLLGKSQCFRFAPALFVKSLIYQIIH